MLNSGKKREDKNEAGLGMRQAGEELLLALPSLAFTGRPRQGLRPWGSGWGGEATHPSSLPSTAAGRHSGLPKPSWPIGVLV